MRATWLKRLLGLHRTLGLSLGVLVLLWALTGVLHPIMSATQPQPAKRMPPPQQLVLSGALPLPQVLQQQGIARVTQVQAIQLAPQQVAYRILLPQHTVAQYMDVQTGQLIPEGERKDAERLALWYSGKQTTDIMVSKVITEFSDDYPSVNRLLPVWQVQFNDGLRAYVDPSQSRLATLSNDQKMWMARIFRLGHTWTWGQTPWAGQHVLMKVALTACMLLLVLGVWLFANIHNRQNHRLKTQPARRFHRRLGMGLSVFILLWLFSGLYHIWQQKKEPVVVQALFNTSDLSSVAWRAAVAKPLQRISLAPLQLQADATATGVWLLQPVGDRGMQGSMTAKKEHAEHQHKGGHVDKDKAPDVRLINATTAEKVQPFDQARHLSAFYSGLPVAQLGKVSWVTTFGGEYGFINKRLPVIKVESNQPDGLRLYIEPATGVLAAQVNNDDALEGFSFAYLHKWTWLPVPKGVRDTLMASVAGLVALLVLLGFRVWWLKRRGHAAV